MKKNVILGALASVFAVSSAFATLAPERAWIRAKTSPTQAFTCLQTSATCDNMTNNTCMVRVDTQINGSNKTVAGRHGDFCSPTLTHSGGIIVTTDLFYDAQ